FAEAIAHLLEAQGRVSNDYAAEFNLALCYVGTGQFQKGISVLIGLREHGRENASVENLLAQAYAGDGQEGQAFEALRRATASTPKNEKLYLFVGGAFLGREEPAQSLRVIELGLQHLPESARLHYERGYLLAMLDDFDGARMDFERAAQIAPGSEIGYLAKAQESLFGGNLAEAMLGILAKLNQEQAQRIRTAPGDSKPIPGASGASRGEQKPQAERMKNYRGSENRFKRI